MKKLLAMFTAVVIIAAAVMPRVTITAGAETNGNSGNWEYVTEKGTVKIKRYNGTEPTITVPGILAGKKVTGIRWDAFSNSASLESVTIPYSVTNIYISAFFGCVNLKSITVDENNMVYSSKNGVLLDKEGNTLIYFPGKADTTISIPNITSIGRSAFYGCASPTITIPNSVTNIGAYAFNCSSLQTIEIPDAVKSIDYGAFYNCKELTSVTFKSQIPPEFFSYKVFVNCPNLTVSVPADAKLW